MLRVSIYEAGFAVDQYLDLHVFTCISESALAHITISTTGFWRYGMDTCHGTSVLSQSQAMVTQTVIPFRNSHRKALPRCLKPGKLHGRPIVEKDVFQVIWFPPLVLTVLKVDYSRYIPSKQVPLSTASTIFCI